MKEIRAGNREGGLKLLREGLAKNPTKEELLAVLTRADYSDLLSLLTDGGDGAKVARAMLDRAAPVLPDLKKD
jgi:hypothetical protein